MRERGVGRVAQCNAVACECWGGAAVRERGVGQGCAEQRSGLRVLGGSCSDEGDRGGAGLRSAAQWPASVGGELQSGREGWGRAAQCSAVACECWGGAAVRERGVGRAVQCSAVACECWGGAAVRERGWGRAAQCSAVACECWGGAAVRERGVGRAAQCSAVACECWGGAAVRERGVGQGCAVQRCAVQRSGLRVLGGSCSEGERVGQGCAVQRSGLRVLGGSCSEGEGGAGLRSAAQWPASVGGELQ